MSFDVSFESDSSLKQHVLRVERNRVTMRETRKEEREREREGGREGGRSWRWRWRWRMELGGKIKSSQVKFLLSTQIQNSP